MAGLRFIWPLIKTTSRWWGSCWGPAASWTFRMTWVLKLLEKSLWAVITTDLKSYTIFLTQLLVRFITGDFTWICFIFPVPCKDKTDRWRECFVNVSYFLSFISFFFFLSPILLYCSWFRNSPCLVEAGSNIACFRCIQRAWPCFAFCALHGP